MRWGPYLLKLSTYSKGFFQNQQVRIFVRIEQNFAEKVFFSGSQVIRGRFRTCFRTFLFRNSY